jgi:hypothetical protein
MAIDSCISITALQTCKKDIPKVRSAKLSRHRVRLVSQGLTLLHFDQLGLLVSTDFRGKTVPPYYTNTVDKCRIKRDCQSIVPCVGNATVDVPLLGCRSDHTSVRIDYGRLRKEYSQGRNTDMEISSCESAFDGLIAICVA